MKRILLVLVGCFTIFTLFPGVAEDTVIETEEGLRDVALIKVGDRIACLDKYMRLKNKEVVAVEKRESDDVMRTTLVDGTTIHASRDQLVYVPSRGTWVQMRDLSKGDKLLKKDRTEVAVEDVTKLDAKRFIYYITLSKNHNFFAQRSGIIVHNWGFAVPLVQWGSTVVVASLKDILTAAVAGYVKEKVCEAIEAKTGKNIRPLMPFAEAAVGGVQQIVQSQEDGYGYHAPRGWHNRNFEAPVDFVANQVSTSRIGEIAENARRAGGIPDARMCAIPGKSGVVDGFSPANFGGNNIPNPNEHGYGQTDKNGPLVKPVFDNGASSGYITKTLAELVGEATPGKPIQSPDEMQVIRPGGLNGSITDFNEFTPAPTHVEDKSNGVRIGFLLDGDKIIWRPTSSHDRTTGEPGPATLEIQQSSGKVIKIRYPENKKADE